MLLWRLCVVSMVFFVLSVGYYLHTVNTLASRGSEMREVELALKELESRHERMMLDEARFRSLYELEDTTETLKLKKLTQIRYIEEIGPVAFYTNN